MTRFITAAVCSYLIEINGVEATAGGFIINFLFIFIFISIYNTVIISYDKSRNYRQK